MRNTRGKKLPPSKRHYLLGLDMPGRKSLVIESYDSCSGAQCASKKRKKESEGEDAIPIRGFWGARQSGNHSGPRMGGGKANSCWDTRRVGAPAEETDKSSNIGQVTGDIDSETQRLVEKNTGRVLSTMGRAGEFKYVNPLWESRTTTKGRQS